MNGIRRLKSKGFTLAEILVALVIIAAVSAVLIPTVVGQINKADPESVVNGALAVRGAVEQFHGDVRRYPLDFADLVVRPVSGDLGVVGGKYAAPELLRWAGPYLQKDATAALKTGWDLSFSPTFTAVNVGTSTTGTATDPLYLTLTLVIDATKALEVDKMLDDGDTTTGLVRWASGTLSYFVVPIQ